MSNFLQAAAGNYKPVRPQKIKYIVIHYTANNGDTAEGNAKYFNRNANLKASAHYFVDEKEIWQAVREADMAYHCGGKSYVHKGCRNANSIGIEMVSRKDALGKYYIKPEVVQRAAALVRQLMAKYGIDSAHVLRHYDVTGKKCPEPFVRNPAEWVKFRQMIVEVSEVEKQQKIKLNGKIKTVHAIEKNGFNYVKLRDLADGKIIVDYRDGLPVVEVN